MNTQITDHHTNPLNKTLKIEPVSVTGPSPDGSYCHYIISGFGDELHIPFHRGPIAVDLPPGVVGDATVTNKGVTNEALLAIVLHRLRGFNSSKFRCKENSMAITKIEEALLWMGARSNERLARGVEGTQHV